jgi:dipeptidase
VEGRSWAYEPKAGEKLTEPIGYIPQVAHTYAFFEGSQGLMNEHQLAIGEGTCKSKTGKGLAAPKGYALFSNPELSRIVLERCKTAREAIKLMGDLSVKYGFYASAETLIVIDPNEGWVWHGMADVTGKSAIWVAQRVPDDEVAAISNQFQIAEIDLNKPDYFMGSDNIYKIAQEQGWWKPGTPFDFSKVYTDGEEGPYFSARRKWRIYDLLAPSLKLSPWVEGKHTRAYPFSIKPDKKVSVQDCFRIMRDAFEGTEFDMTKGPAAGPFGSPNRLTSFFTKGQGEKEVKGEWEYSISEIDTRYSTVSVARNWLPDPIGGVTWYGPSATKTTCYMPLYCGINEFPRSFSTGTCQWVFNREVAWWAFESVKDLADQKFSYMIKDINAVQERREGKQFAMQPAIEQAALMLYKTDPKLAREYLTNYCVDNANNVVSEWWKLFDYLIAKYRSGYLNSEYIPGQTPTSTTLGYPAWWLKAVGYDKGPLTYEKPK